MNHCYSDIMERIAEPPKWWDEYAVPRYCDFAPSEKANIYADEVALVEIQCQGCRTPFLVAFSSSQIERLIHKHRPLADQIVDGSLHYGDPPNIGCCSAGATMNCIDVRVLQYWKMERFDWNRNAELEIEIEQLGVEA